MSDHDHHAKGGAVTAEASPNIAFIKYWGNRDDALRLPLNGSISMNLKGLFTRTTVSFQPSLPYDELIINGREVAGHGLERVSTFLDLVREMAHLNAHAEVITENNFPSSAGIASSASAFAALALASTSAAGLSLTEAELSRLARRGSGSACRSIPGGFVEWEMGTADADSFAHAIAPADHWLLTDCIAILSLSHKKVSSTEGHSVASTSPLQKARVADAPRRLNLCRSAILNRDFESLTAILELDSDMMHAVMMTSTPSLVYLQPETLVVLNAVRQWRTSGLPSAYTVDAGPNVHVICPTPQAEEVTKKLKDLPGIQQVLQATVGGPALLMGSELPSKLHRRNPGKSTGHTH